MNYSVNETTVSLCVSTYNWPEALYLCLQSITQQTVLPNEVIIGDDGSKEETRMLIEKMQTSFPVPLLHVWQPDDGFRLAQMRNKSFAKTSSNYIIQIDGDLILHPSFVEDHLKFAKQGTFLAGARSIISKEATAQLIKTKTINLQFIKQSLSKKYNALRFFPFAFLNYWLNQNTSNYKYVLGANMSFWKHDLIKINGYDEKYIGWGKEDNDLALRFCNANVKLRQLKHGGIVYHLNHDETKRLLNPENEKSLLNTLRNKTMTISNGLDRYLVEKTEYIAN